MAHLSQMSYILSHYHSSLIWSLVLRRDYNGLRTLIGQRDLSEV